MFSLITYLAQKYVYHSSLKTLWSSDFFSRWYSLVPWLIWVLYDVGSVSSTYTLVVSTMYLFLIVMMAKSLNSPIQPYPTPNYVFVLHAYSYMWSLSFLVGNPGTLIKSLAWKTSYAAAWLFFLQLPSYFSSWWILFRISTLWLEWISLGDGTKFPCFFIVMRRSFFKKNISW